MEQSQPPAARKPRVSKSRPKPRTPAPAKPWPVKSKDKAEDVFKDFSLSGFAKDAKPASYVNPADGPAAAHVAQRRIITEHLNRLSAQETPSGGMTLALPAAEIEKLLPSLNAKAATIDLGDVLNVIGQQMRGTEFYAAGNPVLNRVALQARARALITAMRQDPEGAGK
jgi:hypothetical protein